MSGHKDIVDVFGPVKSMVETFASTKGSNMLQVNMVQLKIRQVWVMLDHVRSGHVMSDPIKLGQTSSGQVVR